MNEVCPRTWLIYAWVMTYSYMGRDIPIWDVIFIYGTWLFRMQDSTVSNCLQHYRNSYVTVWYARHDSFIRATWLIHMCDVTHSYVRHDSFICATWLIHTCDMTHSHVSFSYANLTCMYAWHDSFICESWFLHIWDVAFSHARQHCQRLLAALPVVCAPCEVTHTYV